MDNLREHHSSNSAHHIMQAMFSTTIMWLGDTGILNKLKFDVMNPPIPIPDPKLRHKQPLILRQLGIIIIILVVGLNIAIVVFLCEILITFLSQALFRSRSRSNAISADLGEGKGQTVMPDGTYQG